MKARHFRKIKKNELRYVVKKLKRLRQRLNHLQTFSQFECSSFFRGETLAKYNRKCYNKRHKKAVAKFEWYMEIYNRLKDEK